MQGLRRYYYALLFALPLLVLACSGGEEEKKTVQTPIAPAPTETASEIKTPQPAEDFSKVTARMKVLGLDGLPILGMAPIATKQPNAFDAPVATGPLSNKDGLTEFEFPGDQKLYIRAWDPDGRMFANNFFDAVPNTGNVSDELLIQMAPGSIITATLVDANKSPLVDASIDAMLSHPTAGPWWPVAGKTDAAGKLRLGPVPPGQFTISLKDGGNLKLELPATFLPPADTVELGTLVLQ